MRSSLAQWEMFVGRAASLGEDHLCTIESATRLSCTPLPVRRKERATCALATVRSIRLKNVCFQNLECVGFSSRTWPPYAITIRITSFSLVINLCWTVRPLVSSHMCAWFLVAKSVVLHQTLHSGEIITKDGCRLAIKEATQTK